MKINPDSAVSVVNISKQYRVYSQPIHRLWEGLCRGKRKFHTEVNALDDISFEVPRGSTFGIVGRNGSGKSTILQIIAGTLNPSSGDVAVCGRISALLELGSGFNPEFKGVENVFLYGRVLGLTDTQIREKFAEIVEFADIGDAVNQPLWTYSSGMVVRLAFAVAVAVEPEILIVDEALSVGDEYFQHKCMNRMKEIITKGATVIFVSHSASTVTSLCNEAILLDGGKLVSQGTPKTIVQEYHRLLFRTETSKDKMGDGAMFAVADAEDLDAPIAISSEFLDDGAFQKRAAATKFGTGAAKICGIELVNNNGERTQIVHYGENIRCRLHCEFIQPSAAAVVGIMIRNSNGQDILGTNTHIEKIPLRNIEAGERLIVEFEFPILMGPGNYSVSPAIIDEEYFYQPHYSEWVDDALVFSVPHPKETVVYGVFYPKQVNVKSWRNAGSASTLMTAQLQNVVGS